MWMSQLHRETTLLRYLSTWITTCKSSITGITEYIKARNTLVWKRISYRDECQGMTLTWEMETVIKARCWQPVCLVFIFDSALLCVCWSAMSAGNNITCLRYGHLLGSLLIVAIIITFVASSVAVSHFSVAFPWFWTLHSDHDNVDSILCVCFSARSSLSSGVLLRVFF